MSKPKPPSDPRGHSLRIYDDIFKSPAFASLSPHDKVAYLALLHKLLQYNNGDLSLPLSRAKTCGISHSKTLARSLRALRAVGLVAVTREGGCTRGGQRLATLYRVTDRDCYDIPQKFIEAKLASNEWKLVKSVQQGLDLIEAAEKEVKKRWQKLRSLGHAVPLIRAPRDVVKATTRAPSDTWNDGLGHGVILVENVEMPMSMQVSEGIPPLPGKAGHRAWRMPPLYVANPGGGCMPADGQGTYHRLTFLPVNLFNNLIN
jgi:hypothetical protein